MCAIPIVYCDMNKLIPSFPMYIDAISFTIVSSLVDMPSLSEGEFRSTSFLGFFTAWIFVTFPFSRYVSVFASEVPASLVNQGTHAYPTASSMAYRANFRVVFCPKKMCLL